MNLYNNPSITQLKPLIAQCENLLIYYDLMVNHEGDVIIKPTAESSIEDLTKYNFYFRAFLRGRHSVGKAAINNSTYLNQLLKDLMYCHENNMHGEIDHDELAKVQYIYSLIRGREEKRELQTADITVPFFQ